MHVLVTEIKIIRHNDIVINMLNHILILEVGIILLLDAMGTIGSLVCFEYHFPQHDELSGTDLAQ